MHETKISVDIGSLDRKTSFTNLKLFLQCKFSFLNETKISVDIGSLKCKTCFTLVKQVLRP